MQADDIIHPARPESLSFGDGGQVPNNPRLPVLVYRGVAPEGDRAAAFERVFRGNGWTGAWRNGIYGYHHFHSDAHEVLGIAAGQATVRLGGEDGETVAVKAGDVLVLPAGTGHKRLDASPDLLVVGAYPGGRQPDMHTEDAPGDREAVRENIRRVPLPQADPLYGEDGPLLRLWRP